jgi:hypothetical protein
VKHWSQWTEADRKAAYDALKAADAIRANWMNDGHDLREPALGYLKAARTDYDRARRAIT